MHSEVQKIIGINLNIHQRVHYRTGSQVDAAVAVITRTCGFPDPTAENPNPITRRRQHEGDLL